MTDAQRRANKAQDAKRGPGLTVRLSEAELIAAERLKREGETIQGLLRRLLREAANPRL